jgi:hypothetical protein
MERHRPPDPTGTLSRVLSAALPACSHFNATLPSSPAFFFVAASGVCSFPSLNHLRTTTLDNTNHYQIAARLALSSRHIILSRHPRRANVVVTRQPAIQICKRRAAATKVFAMQTLRVSSNEATGDIHYASTLLLSPLPRRFTANNHTTNKINKQTNTHTHSAE